MAKTPLPGLQAIEGLGSLLAQIERGEIATPFDVILEHGESGERFILKFGKDLAKVKMSRDSDPAKTFATVKLVLASTDYWKLKVGCDAKKKPIFLSNLDA